MTYAPALDAHDIDADEPTAEEWLATLESEAIKLGRCQYSREFLRMGGNRNEYIRRADEEARYVSMIETARARILDALRRADGDD